VREPIASEEAEIGVVGCCMLDNNAIDEAVTAGIKTESGP
jgi:hypothetical protein